MTSITVQSDKAGKASLNVMDVTGKQLLNKTISVNNGETIIELNASELPVRGVLYYELQMENTRIMKKMVLIKQDYLFN